MNVNAGRGGYDPATTTAKPNLKKLSSNLGTATAPCGGGGSGGSKSPVLKKEKSGVSMQMTKLDESFFGGQSSHSSGELPRSARDAAPRLTSGKSSLELDFGGPML